MLKPIDVAKELLSSLVDSPDPSLNYIHALGQLIALAERAEERDLSYDKYLKPFTSRYEHMPVTHDVGRRVVSECGPFRFLRGDGEDAARSVVLFATCEEMTGYPVVYEFVRIALGMVHDGKGVLEVDGSEVAQHGSERGGWVDDDTILVRCKDHVFIRVGDVLP